MLIKSVGFISLQFADATNVLGLKPKYFNHWAGDLKFNTYTYSSKIGPLRSPGVIPSGTMLKSHTYPRVMWWKSSLLISICWQQVSSCKDPVTKCKFCTTNISLRIFLNYHGIFPWGHKLATNNASQIKFWRQIYIIVWCAVKVRRRIFSLKKKIRFVYNKKFIDIHIIIIY